MAAGAPPPPAATSEPKRSGKSDLGARVAVAVPAAIILLILLHQGGLVFTIAVTLVGLVALHELYAMFPTARPAKLAGFAGLIAVMLTAHYGDQYDVLLAAMAVIPLAFVLTIAQPGGGEGMVAIALTLMGVYWIALALAHGILLRDLPHGEGVIIDVLLGTFIGDSGAYFGGRAFGRRKLAPIISPNKTVEGLAIGILSGIAAVEIAGLYQDWLSGTQALLLGLAVALVAPLGDLFESYLKRDAGTKDTGTLFGAHGGALDRIDAVLFSAVVGYYVWHAML
jgi:phosphatidate cytidylyltransferase